jgi:hypothetical protein
VFSKKVDLSGEAGNQEGERRGVSPPVRNVPHRRAYAAPLALDSIPGSERNKQGRSGHDHRSWAEAPRDDLEQEQDQEHDQEQTEDTAGAIAPTAAVRPGREAAHQQDD